MGNKRKKVGLLYITDESWMGGIYYILNVVNGFKQLEESIKPHLSIFYWEKDKLNPIKVLKYPYITFYPLSVKYSFLEKVINKLCKIIFNKSFINKKYNINHAESIFPYKNTPTLQAIENIPKRYYWIPDFQEIYYPNFFLDNELNQRKKIRDEIASSQCCLVLSSNSVQNDFMQLYPIHCCNIKLLPFVSFLPDYLHINVSVLLKKYTINTPYFIVCNQFWQHKNHLVVLKALNELKQKNIPFQIVFTGKKDDYRNENYFALFEKYINDNQLQSFVKILGLIDRSEQLRLMKNSIAVIQPSLFEGWSTVVEDVKAINHFILVSNIPVHREQLDYNCLFFHPLDHQHLTVLMENLLQKGVKVEFGNYNEKVNKFVLNLQSVFLN